MRLEDVAGRAAGTVRLQGAEGLHGASGGGLGRVSGGWGRAGLPGRWSRAWRVPGWQSWFSSGPCHPTASRWFQPQEGGMGRRQGGASLNAVCSAKV